MLLQFSVKNYRTFKDKASLSLIASNYDKTTRIDDNIISESKFGYKILKSAVVYGANASGKSKLIEAISFMRHFAINSSKDSLSNRIIDVKPFLLNEESENEPSEFEVIFVYKEVIYRYGFEVLQSEVVSEWLYYQQKTKEVELFNRDRNNFEVHSRDFIKGKKTSEVGLVRDNSLFLSVAAQFNEIEANNVINWFKSLIIISGLDESGYIGVSIGRADNLNHKQGIIEFLKAADVGINDISLKKIDIAKLPKEIPKEMKDDIVREIKEGSVYFSDVMTSHKKYNIERKFVENISFSLEKDESSGTQQFFAMTGPILEALESGSTLIVDEFDIKLHSNLLCSIVSLFNSNKFNTKNSQLIFNTHDTNLLSSGLFRRDQIWFTEKNKFGEAKLYSLSDFKARKGEAFEENYIIGKYGAIPYLGFFENLLISLLNEKKATL